ncbi:MAG TPA: hypothetical protein DCX25_01435 [Candidatus Pacebacteria bacterium]|nr:MAG: Glycosyl transferase group 1 [Microgenomates group bacterium GW2011_GWB1_45_17]KKU22816.1 MAG: Glycosyl transferase group 1 [Microgenomates group bacterium GW2011_GWA1_46_15]KKU23423.1 MAG: group 1 glycosyl transferase [Microgenomates group bacterium GW2011_GWC1_46_15]HAV14967.1 hypothetical protein [Candidatus Paceibacterota bacterium]HCR11616.1 hypothetical protein [Candidatus Paceibacterota bacterium]
MRIGINAYEANVANRVGSNEFAYQVLIHLEKLLRDDDVIIYLPSPPLQDMPKSRKGWMYAVIPPAGLWSVWRLPLALLRKKLFGKSFDVFFSLGHYAPLICPFPSVISIMDLAYEKFPQFFKKSDVMKLKVFTRASVKKAAHMIAISQHTKQDLVKLYGVSANHITVAYPGVEEHQLVGSSVRILQGLKVREPYIVYVGTIQPRKNIARLVKAFEKVKQKKKYADLSLVIAGKVGWMADDVMHAIQHSLVKHHVKLLGFVTEEQKLTLYKHAVAAVLVGLYEGFGIPPLEAMLAGTVPLVSNTASLPEVVGGTGVQVDPLNSDDIARGIEEVLEYTTRQRQEMIAQGKVQASQFSWENTALRVARVLHEVGARQIGGKTA